MLSRGKKKEEEQEVASYNLKYLTMLTNLKEMIYFFLGTSQINSLSSRTSPALIN